MSGSVSPFCGGTIRVPRMSGSSVIANAWSHDADRARGWDQYVPPCLLGEPPRNSSARQDGRLKDTVFLRVKPEAILVSGVMGSLDVSNKKGVPVRRLTPEAAATSSSAHPMRH